MAKGRVPRWPKEDKGRVQCLLAYKALIDLEREQKTDETKASTSLLNLFHNQIAQVELVECMGAENMSLDECKTELHFATGSLATGNGKGYTPTSMWKKGKRLHKILRNVIHAAFLRATEKNLLGNSDMRDNLKALKEEMWAVDYAKPVVTATDVDEVGETEPAAEETEEVAEEAEQEQQQRSKTAEEEAELEAAPAEAEDANSEVTELLLQPMRSDWAGPYDLHLWLGLGPWGERNNQFNS